MKSDRKLKVLDIGCGKKKRAGSSGVDYSE